MSKGIHLHDEIQAVGGKFGGIPLHNVIDQLWLILDRPHNHVLWSCKWQECNKYTHPNPLYSVFEYSQPYVRGHDFLSMCQYTDLSIIRHDWTQAVVVIVFIDNCMWD